MGGGGDAVTVGKSLCCDPRERADELNFRTRVGADSDGKGVVFGADPRERADELHFRTRVGADSDGKFAKLFRLSSSGNKTWPDHLY